MLEDYLKELSKIELLSSDEENELWYAYKCEADLLARQRIIESYQPLVFKAVKEIGLTANLAMDMIQEGTVGLIEAAERYDHTKGVAFSVYARHRVRGRILNLLQSQLRTGLISLDETWGYEGEQGPLLAELVDVNADSVESQVEAIIARSKVNEVVSRLEGKERTVITAVYLKDQEPSHVARDMKISLSYLYKLQKRAIRRMRGMLSRQMSQLNEHG